MRRAVAEAELLRRPQHELLPQARKVSGARRCRGQVVEHEVAIGHGVDRVRGHPLEAERARDLPPVGVEVHAGERAGAEWQGPGLIAGEGKARPIALEHPEVGEQVMPEVHGLGSLQVGVARHRPVRVLDAALEQDAHQRADVLDRSLAALAREQGEVGGHLIVARARGVQAPADRSGDSVSRRSTAMWMSSSSGWKANVSSASSRSTASRPASSASASAAAMIPRSASIGRGRATAATSWGHSRRSKPMEERSGGGSRGAGARESATRRAPVYGSRAGAGPEGEPRCHRRLRTHRRAALGKNVALSPLSPV